MVAVVAAEFRGRFKLIVRADPMPVKMFERYNAKPGGRAFPLHCPRLVLTEIYHCDVCSCHESKEETSGAVLLTASSSIHTGATTTNTSQGKGDDQQHRYIELDCNIRQVSASRYIYCIDVLFSVWIGLVVERASTKSSSEIVGQDWADEHRAWLLHRGAQ